MPRLILAALLCAAGGARAEDGMWTLDNLPRQALKDRYGFEPTPQWVDKVRLASVRFNDGGSGSFVSPEGLVLTNHHVALGQLQKVSSEKKDYVKDGFYARERAEELPCPDLELNVLVAMVEVTTRVLAAVDPKAPEGLQNELRKGEMAKVEKESQDATGLRSDVIELYAGGEYWLYRYKKYKDIRLVMAPEQQAAFYGGDPDNFTYPRFDLDFAFFRVYEDGRPVRSEAFLKWHAPGAVEGDLVFVSGHPGSTDRLRTMSQLAYERDHWLPARLKSFKLRAAALTEYSARGPEQARRAKDKLFSFENAIKAETGEFEGLQDPKLWAQKEAEEKAFRAQVSAKPELEAAYGGAWDKIAGAQAELTRRHKERSFRSFRGARLADWANTIVRYVAEVEKPNEKRYEEFRESALDSLRHRLFTKAPTYPDLEERLLAVSLWESLEELGRDDAHVQAALGGGSPEEIAKRLVSGTKLADPEVRKRLVDGGKAAVEASDDPLIVWARGLDPSYRELRKWFEDGIESVEALEGNKIAKARFAAFGRTTYPDATFTLRLSYGSVAGYPLGTTRVPYKTTFHGLYDRSASFDDKPPFDLSPLEKKQKAEVRLETPLNFVTTNDIIGGNSGSPVLDREARLVGLIFDGNIQGLVWRYAFQQETGRAVAVHSGGILEALRSIYSMKGLERELTRAAAN